MSDTPATPSPLEALKLLARSLGLHKAGGWLWAAWSQAVAYSGPVALALVLWQHQGCALPDDGHRPHPPKPPTPPPTPAVVPIPAAGLHILIVEESKDRAGYKPGQLDAIHSKEFRTYALQHAAKDGGSPGVWHIDKDDDTAGLPAHFREGAAFALKDDSPFPRILVCNPAKGFFIGSVPDNAQALIDLCKKYE